MAPRSTCSCRQTRPTSSALSHRGTPTAPPWSSTRPAVSRSGHERIVASTSHEASPRSADPRVRRLAIANPDHAPYGRAAVEALRRAGVYEQVRARLVLGENVSQAAQFAQTGNADVGIIALSLTVAPAMRGVGSAVELPQTAFPEIRQTGVVLAHSVNKDGARAASGVPVTARDRRPAARVGFRRLTVSGIDWQAIALSVRLATVVVLLLLIVGYAARLVAHLPPTALDLRARGRRRLAAGAAADGARLLHARRHGTAQSARARLDGDDRPRTGVHLRGAGARVTAVQPAVRGAADCRRVRTDRPDIARGVVDARRVRPGGHSRESLSRFRATASWRALCSGSRIRWANSGSC